MSETSVFGNSKIIGERIEYNPRKWFDLPRLATHVFVNPVKRGNEYEVVISFRRAGLLEDYKPQNSAGKFFCRPDGKAQCRVEAQQTCFCWRYKVDWR